MIGQTSLSVATVSKKCIERRCRGRFQLGRLGGRASELAVGGGQIGWAGGEFESAATAAATWPSWCINNRGRLSPLARAGPLAAASIKQKSHKFCLWVRDVDSLQCIALDRLIARQAGGGQRRLAGGRVRKPLCGFRSAFNFRFTSLNFGELLAVSWWLLVATRER